jgi:hypothetical protein
MPPRLPQFQRSIVLLWMWCWRVFRSHRQCSLQCLPAGPLHQQQLCFCLHRLPSWHLLLQGCQCTLLSVLRRYGGDCCGLCLLHLLPCRLHVDLRQRDCVCALPAWSLQRGRRAGVCSVRRWNIRGQYGQDHVCAMRERFLRGSDQLFPVRSMSCWIPCGEYREFNLSAMFARIVHKRHGTDSLFPVSTWHECRGCELQHLQGMFVWQLLRCVWLCLLLCLSRGSHWH